MNLRFVFTFIILLTSALSKNATGQNNITYFHNQLSEILDGNDVNEKKYRLSIFNQEFNNWLLQNDIGEELIEEPLKVAVTDDDLFSLYYYTQHDMRGIDYGFFVKYRNDAGDVQVHFFSEKMKPVGKSTDKVKDPVIRLTSQLLNGVKMYEVSFSDSENQLVWKKYSDLKLKCMFEELGKTKNDDYKIALNKLVVRRLEYIWQSPMLFDDGFSGIGRMKTLFSEDKNIKICTYGIFFNDFSNLFYGAVIIKEDKDKVNVFLLNDNSEAIRSPTRASLTNNKWYGATYLDIIEKQYKKKIYFTLLGYRGQDEFVKKRVIDVLWFSGGKPRFGSPIFKPDRYTYNRLIYKYSLGANMLLRYDEKEKMIVMDNLVPSEPYYKGVYRFYGPDFSYNGFKFEKGKWILYNNIDLRNPK